MDTYVCNFSSGTDIFSAEFCKEPKPFMGVDMLCHKDDNIYYQCE